jgi:hypothetical protein
MKNSFVFASTCPACGQQRLQQGHTPSDLIRLIEFHRIIDAYCLECDMVWPVSTEERLLIACAIAIRPSDASAIHNAAGAKLFPFMTTPWLAGDELSGPF